MRLPTVLTSFAAIGSEASPDDTCPAYLEIKLKLPTKLSITVTADRRPLPGMWIVLEFPMSQKNPYQLAFGPSEAQGRISITEDEIRQEALKVNQLFLMDYAPLETYWTRALRVMPMGRAALQRALSASRLFKRYKYPAGYQHSLAAADAALQQMNDAELSASVQCEATELPAIEVVPVRASHA